MPSNTNRPPRRGPMGGGRGMSVPGEKAKDFKGAVKRLLKELNKFRNQETIKYHLELAKAKVEAENRYLGIQTKELELYQKMSG